MHETDMFYKMLKCAEGLIVSMNYEVQGQLLLWTEKTAEQV